MCRATCRVILPPLQVLMVTSSSPYTTVGLQHKIALREDYWCSPPLPLQGREGQTDLRTPFPLSH